MRHLIAGLLIVATPALAQQKPSDAQVVGDIASQPVQDLNLKTKHIPEVLERATGDPYAVRTLRNCRAINGAIAALTVELGPDFNSPEESGARKISGTKVAKSIVQSLIPFRGVIREASGAAGAARRYEAAVDAGIARRGFLRGVARSRGCRVG